MVMKHVSILEAVKLMRLVMESSIRSWKDAWLGRAPLCTSDGLSLIATKIGTRYTKETICIEYEWKPPRCSTCLLFGHSIDDYPKAPKRVLNMMDKGKGQTSGADDEGFLEVKRKKSSGNKGGTKNFKSVSVKPKTQNHPEAKKSTDGTSNSPKTNPGCNSFETLNIDNSINEEVAMGSKATTSGAQEGIGYGPKSLWEQLRETTVDDEYDPYDYDIYERGEFLKTYNLYVIILILSRPVNVGRTKAEFDVLILDIASLKTDEVVDSDLAFGDFTMMTPSRLPNRLNLSSRGLDIDLITCLVCNGYVESNAHTFFACDTTSVVWCLVRSWTGSTLPFFNSCDDWDNWFQSWHASKDKKDCAYAIFAATYIKDDDLSGIQELESQMPFLDEDRLSAPNQDFAFDVEDCRDPSFRYLV
ncbi:hypothetical protein Tco_1501711 [Tanacetum coccineum]